MQNGIYGYSVCIWADNGEVRSQSAEGVYQDISENVSANQFLAGLTAIAVFGFVSVTAYVKKRTRMLSKQGILKTGGVIVLICSLISLFLVQPSFAYPSSTYGSNFDIDEYDERVRINQISQEINNMASQTTYTPHTYILQDFTRQSIYLGANDHGDEAGIIFYVGHGGYTSGPTLCANNYSDPYITSQQIYDNSYQHTSIGKFVFLWSCHLGESISGMPYAWLHTTSISSDGYHNPDYTWKCFVGWKNLAPFLTNDYDGQTDAGYFFVFHFYYAAFSLGYNVNAALDYATQQLWQVNFDSGSNRFYTEWYEGIWPFGGVCGPMVVYGQGTLYIGNEAYVQSYVDMAAGWYMAQVTDPYFIEGPSDDGQYAELQAIAMDDYAWVTGYMQREVSSGHVYLWGYSDSEYSHLTVYISDDYYNWRDIYDDTWLAWSEPRAIDLGDCGYSFRYIAICVRNDQGYPARLYVDAVHVTS